VPTVAHDRAEKLARPTRVIAFRRVAAMVGRGHVPRFSSAVLAPELPYNLAIWRDTWTDGEALALHAPQFLATQLATHPLANA